MKSETKNQITELLAKASRAHRQIMMCPTAASGFRSKTKFLLSEIREKIEGEPGFESVNITLTKLFSKYKLYAVPQGCRAMPEFHEEAERQLKILSDDFELTGAKLVSDNNMFKAQAATLQPRNQPNTTPTDVPQLSREEHEKKFKQELLTPKPRVDPHGMPTPIKIEGPLPSGIANQAIEEEWKQEQTRMKALGLAEEDMGD